MSTEPMARVLPPTTPGRALPVPLMAGNCPAGGDHAPIPVQGKNYSECVKCGCRC